MARKIPAIAFVLVLLISSLNPIMELSLQKADLVTPVGNYDGQWQQDQAQQVNAQNSQNFYADGEPMYTPVPMPTPSPSPTPMPTPTPIPTPLPTPMVKGMSGPDVQKLQSQLLMLGFLEELPDGIYGKSTEAAVTKLQTYLNEVERAKAQAMAVSIAASNAADGAAQTLGFTEGIALADSAQQEQPILVNYAVNGVADGQLLNTLTTGDFPVYMQTDLQVNSTGSEVMRLQSRLNSLKYIYKNVDGAFGATTQTGLMYFQKLHGLPETGIADANTLNTLYSPLAKISDKPLHDYMAVVDVSDQRVYIYAYRDGEYSERVKTFRCSTGLSSTPTPLGTFSEGTGPGQRWHHFSKFNCWAQYAFYIDGDILFHSVLFMRKGGSPTSASVNNLGSRASHGCVRLAVKDAQWIWTNLNAGTTVIVRK